MKLGLREANQNFAKAIRAVRRGEEVVLTERGKPIAVIKPVHSANDQDARLRALAAEGLIIPPSRRGRLPRWKPVAIKGKSLSQTIVEDREDRA